MYNYLKNSLASKIYIYIYFKKILKYVLWEIDWSCKIILYYYLIIIFFINYYIDKYVDFIKLF